MVVTLKLKSGLDKILENNVIEYDVTGEKTLMEVLTEVHFPVEKAGAVLVNGMLTHKNCKLRGGETVKVFPAKFA